MVSVSLAFTLSAIVLGSAFAQTARFVMQSKCFFQKNCIDCLDADIECAWCTDEEYEMRKSRCMPIKDLLQSNCNATKIETNDDYFVKETITSMPHRDFDARDLDAIQISPQKFKLSIGKLAPKTISFTYKPANNYPLDMYYLMDLTWSMRDDKTTLQTMGNQLVMALANLTANYRLGFGSFADKPLFPFIQAEPHRLKNPCYSENDQCEPTYDFRHRLKITRDIDSFIEQVTASDVTGNLDNLEGGLDALMQILLCDEKIGWGSNTRKIVLVATDGWMHMAGDGLLAGVVERNARQCHLDDAGNLVDALKYDYPSLEEIWRVLLRTKTAVIFAVTDPQQDYYKRLSGLMPEFTSVGILQNDSSNILQLVDEGYREFVKRVEFTDDAPAYLQLHYTTDCGGLYKEPRPINRCDNIEIGKEYVFHAEIRLLEYPKNAVAKKQKLTVRIEEKLISNEAVELEIELRDACGCQDLKKPLELDKRCSLNGDYICGVCECYAGWIGKECECNLQNSLNRKELFEQCVAPSNGDELRTGPICSDRGDCVCGQCACQTGYTGDYCECNDCSSIDGKTCGGPDHGFCSCGTCNCYDSWTGDNCDCSTDISRCKAPLNNDICSGHGTCICGRCSCHETFFGPFCETKDGEQSALCSSYEDCVRCAVNRKNDVRCNDLEKTCWEKIGQHRVDFTSTEQISPNCTLRFTKGEDVCDYKFSYELDANRLTLLKVDDFECKPINLLTAGLSIATTVIVAGLILLICCRLKLMYDDKKMYANFENERKQQTQYQEQSPLYKSPITEFQVPSEMQTTTF